MTQLIQPLFDGPIDIVGDVHGEFAALTALLATLGYDADGRHADRRRLVFVGDLCDRGPDSLSVIALVRRLVENGQAQCLLGNHEFNVVKGDRKQGNHWFFGEETDAHRDHYGRAAMATSAQAQEISAFFLTLPLALENEALRVVHAAWDQTSIDACRPFDGNVIEAYEHFETLLRTPDWHRLKDAREDEKAQYGELLENRDWSNPVLLPAAAAFETYEQRSNPIKVLTSGLEQPTTRPFFTSGRWRFTERVRWWKTYHDPKPVVFGHYWRWWDPVMHTHHKGNEPYVFDSDPPMGWHRNDQAIEKAFCVDYSAGVRYWERKRGHARPFQGRLAALRWPEREVVFDDPVHPVLA